MFNNLCDANDLVRKMVCKPTPIKFELMVDRSYFVAPTEAILLEFQQDAVNVMYKPPVDRGTLTSPHKAVKHPNDEMFKYGYTHKIRLSDKYMGCHGRFQESLMEYQSA